MGRGYPFVRILTAFLSGFRSEAGLSASSLAGAFWETYVVGQVARHMAISGEGFTPIHYWRKAAGPEVDLVVERAAGAILGIECKLKEHPTIGDAAGLRALVDAEGGRVKDKLIVCHTKVPYKLADGTWVVDLATFLKDFLGS